MRGRGPNGGCHKGGSPAMRFHGKKNNKRKKGDERHSVVLPPLLPTNSSLMETLATDFSLATQELRLTIMQRASVVDEMCSGACMAPNQEHIPSENFPGSCTTDIDVDSWRKPMECGASYAEDATTRNGETFLREMPWYQPPLRVSTLVQRCCYPDDVKLFSSFNLKDFSVASICSGCSSMNGGEEDAQQGQKAIHKSGGRSSMSAASTHRKTGGTSSSPAPAIGLRNTHNVAKASRMQLQRFHNRINQWCDVVMSLKEERVCFLDPVVLHEEKMAVIYKKEEDMLSVLELKRREEMQEREDRRRLRQREQREQGGISTLQPRRLSQHRWRTLLSSWTKGEEVEVRNIGRRTGGRGILPLIPAPSGATVRAACHLGKSVHRPQLGV